MVVGVGFAAVEGSGRSEVCGDGEVKVDIAMVSVAVQLAVPRFARCACFSLLCWSVARRIAVSVSVSVLVLEVRRAKGWWQQSEGSCFSGN